MSEKEENELPRNTEKAKISTISSNSIDSGGKSESDMWVFFLNFRKKLIKFEIFTLNLTKT